MALALSSWPMIMINPLMAIARSSPMVMTMTTQTPSVLDDYSLDVKNVLSYVHSINIFVANPWNCSGFARQNTIIPLTHNITETVCSHHNNGEVDHDDMCDHGDSRHIHLRRHCPFASTRTTTNHCVDTDYD